MNLAKKYQHILKELIEKKACITFRIMEIEKEVIAKGNFKFLFDIYLEAKPYLLIIETEFNRTDPIMNIIKTAYWLRNKSINKRVILIQLFNAKYYGESKNRPKKELAVYLGQRIHLLQHQSLKQMYYRSIEFNINKNDSNRYDDFEIRQSASLSANKITRILNNHVGVNYSAY